MNAWANAKICVLLEYPQLANGRLSETLYPSGVKQRAILSRLGVETASNSFHPSM